MWPRHVVISSLSTWSLPTSSASTALPRRSAAQSCTSEHESISIHTSMRWAAQAHTQVLLFEMFLWITFCHSCFMLNKHVRVDFIEPLTHSCCGNYTWGKKKETTENVISIKIRKTHVHIITLFKDKLCILVLCTCSLLRCVFFFFFFWSDRNYHCKCVNALSVSVSYL